MSEKDKNEVEPGIPMELPIIRYHLVDVMNGYPAICPRCCWRNIVHPPEGDELGNLLCPECEKSGKEIPLVHDIHWESISVIRTVEEENIEISDEQCCEDFFPSMDALHNSCENAALNGVGIKLPTIRYCPWCGKKVNPNMKRKEPNESKT